MESVPRVLYFIGHVSPREDRANENPGAYGGQTAHSFSQEDFRQFIDQTAAARREKRLLRIDVEHKENVVCGRINMLFEAKDGMFGCIGHVTQADVIQAILQNKKQGLSASAYHIQTATGYVRHLVSVSIVASPWYAERNTYIKMATTEPRNALNEFKVNYLPWVRYINAADRAVLENMPVYEPTDPKSKILDAATREHFLFPTTHLPEPSASFISRSWHTRHFAEGGTTELPVSDTIQRIATMSASDPSAAIPQSTTTAATTAAPIGGGGGSSDVQINSVAANDVEMTEASGSMPQPFISSTPKQDLGDRKTAAKRDAPTSTNTAAAAATGSVAPPAKEAKLQETEGDDIDFFKHLPAEQTRVFLSMAKQFKDARESDPRLTGLDFTKTLQYAKVGLESEAREAAAKRESELKVIQTAYGDEYTEEFKKKLDDPQEFQVHLKAAQLLNDRRAREQAAAAQREAAAAQKEAERKASLEMYTDIFGSLVAGSKSGVPNVPRFAESVVSSKDAPAQARAPVPVNGALAKTPVGTALATPIGSTSAVLDAVSTVDMGRMGYLRDAPCMTYRMVERVDSSATGGVRRILNPAVQRGLEDFFSVNYKQYEGGDVSDILDENMRRLMVTSVEKDCNDLTNPNYRAIGIDKFVMTKVEKYGYSKVESDFALTEATIGRKELM